MEFVSFLGRRFLWSLLVLFGLSIVIFAIAFDLADTSPIKQRLKACSSNGLDGKGAKLYYDAKSSADLLAAFAAITSQISSLRVAH